jgi:hypothetical protein
VNFLRPRIPSRGGRANRLAGRRARFELLWRPLRGFCKPVADCDIRPAVFHRNPVAGGDRRDWKPSVLAVQTRRIRSGHRRRYRPRVSRIGVSRSAQRMRTFRTFLRMQFAAPLLTQSRNSGRIEYIRSDKAARDIRRAAMYPARYQELPPALDRSPAENGKKFANFTASLYPRRTTRPFTWTPKHIWGDAPRGYSPFFPSSSQNAAFAHQYRHK